MRGRFWVLGILACGMAAADDESTAVFRSDVSMGRIDALVLDRSQHPIGGLRKDDFVLRQNGEPVAIRDIAYEDLPVDVLLLLDVSGSMKVHIEKVASAAHEALAVLGDRDRVGIMVFTTRTRLRLPFNQDLEAVERKLDDVVQSESFNGGTNINGALLDAAAFVERDGRRQTRHAIVIVTDDQAPRCDQAKISAALDRADAVLMVLLAPTISEIAGPYPGGRAPRSGQPPVAAPWPGAGGPGGPLGGIIFGRRGSPTGLPGSPPVRIGYPSGTEGGSAGSPEIARASGGDSLNVNDASAVESTFERIRRRYALYFYLPDGSATEKGVQLDLADPARRRHPDAALQYRQVTLAADGTRPGLITRVPARPPSRSGREPAKADAAEPPALGTRRRPAVNDSSGPRVTTTESQTDTRQPASTDSAQNGVAPRRRAISDPGSTPRVVIVPSQTSGR